MIKVATVAVLAMVVVSGSAMAKGKAEINGHSRQKECGIQWKAAKAEGKTEGLTWPKYWSQCNKRLKEQATPDKE